MLSDCCWAVVGWVEIEDEAEAPIDESSLEGLRSFSVGVGADMVAKVGCQFDRPRLLMCRLGLRTMLDDISQMISAWDVLQKGRN